MAKKNQVDPETWAVTQSEFCQMTGMQHKQIYNWEDNYGIPCGRGREKIFLTEVWQAIKNIFKENKMLFGNEEAMLRAKIQNEKLRADLEEKKQRTRKLKTENELKEGSLVSRERVAEVLERLAIQIRGVGENLGGKQTVKGSDAQAMVNAAINSLAKEIAAMQEK